MLMRVEMSGSYSALTRGLDLRGKLAGKVVRIDPATNSTRQEGPPSPGEMPLPVGQGGNLTASKERRILANRGQMNSGPQGRRVS